MQNRHTQDAQDRIDDLVERLREAVSETDDPRAEALFETSAEVLLGLRTAFEHYQRRSEEAWRADDG